MSLRLEFVKEALQQRTTFGELCARYGISEKTGYKWRARFLVEGPAGLADRSHAPHEPQRMAARLEALLVTARRAHPTWGARKLRTVLVAAHPREAWPAASTLTAALHRAGLVEPRRARVRRAHVQFPLTVAGAPNDLWSTDYKGEFRTGDGRYCYPLTVLDAASRQLLACRAREQISGAETQVTFRRLFQRYGLPDVIRSDNGSPFASTGVRQLSRLSVWWLRLGIRVERIRPGHPEENGVHERMHRTLKAEATVPPGATCRAQQRRFDAFRREYNEERPHEALGYVAPATRYAPSPRPWPARVPAVEYPAHYVRRRVFANGSFGWAGVHHFLSSTLAGEDVGLERIGETEWAVYFGALLLGVFTPGTGELTELTQLPDVPN